MGEKIQSADLPRSAFLIVAAFFLLSGLSSLIYQVIWTRLLVFVFGSTTFATSTVLAVFMGGLALGSYVAGRWADNAKRPFLWYGILEGIIGLWALATPLLFSFALPLYKSLFLQLHEQQYVMLLVRFLVASIVLLPPTACMGATLPLLSRFVTASLSTVGDRVGTLYAVNTLGAVFGSFAAGFFLIPELGLSITTWIAAAMNLLLAFSVFFVAKSVFKESTEAPASESAGGVASESAPSATVTAEASSGASPLVQPDPTNSLQGAPARMSGVTLATMISFAISGALAMVCEVAWTRSLLLVIGSTTYAFTVMLCTFLLGIFLGSLVCARYVDRLKQPIVVFALAEIGVCFTGFVSLILFSQLPYWNLGMLALLPNDPAIIMFSRFLTSALVLVPITLFMGAIFPLAVKICANDLSRIGSSIGKLYSVNTVGAIFGAFLAGFFIIPMLGPELALIVTFVANLFLGLVLLFIFGKLRTGIKVFVCLGAMAVCAWVVQKPQIWDKEVLTHAQTHRRQIVARPELATLDNLAKWKESLRTIDTLFYKDGVCASVAISEGKNPHIRVLYTNGHADASDTYDMENQALASALPLLLKPDAKNVCVVGWGSGVTAGAALQFPILDMICVEIEPAVLETSKFFHHVNWIPEQDKRTRLERTDGRNFLLCTPEKYDVIVSEPSNPWQPGVCNLFTKEYFQICRDGLNKNGIFSMWSQIYEMPTKDLQHILSALREVFPHVFVFDSGSGDVCAIASVEPFKLSPALLAKSLSDPRVAKSFAPFKMKTPEDFLARIRMSPGGLNAGVGKALPNTDDKNFLEFDIAKGYENAVYKKQNLEWMLNNQGEIWNFIDWSGTSKADKARECAKVAEHCLLRDRKRALTWAKASLEEEKNNAAYAVIAQAHMMDNDYAGAKQVLDEADKACKPDGQIDAVRGSMALRLSNYTEARASLEKAVALDPKNSLYKFLLAQTYAPLDLGQQNVYQAPPDLNPARVIQLCSELEQDPKFVARQPSMLFVLGDAYLQAGKVDDAIRVLKQAVQIIPDAYIPWRLLSKAYSIKKQWRDADICSDKSAQLAAAQVGAVITNGAIQEDAKNFQGALQNYRLALEMSPSNKAALMLLSNLAKRYEKARVVLDKMNTGAMNELPKDEKKAALPQVPQH